MRLPRFDSEQYMTWYENACKYNITDTSMPAMKFKNLLTLCPDLSETVMDYGEITGNEDLKYEILKLYKSGEPKNLAFFHGALEADEHVMMVLLEPEDEVVTLIPGYQQFYDYPASLGCKVQKVQLNEKDWSIDFDALNKAVNSKTKMFILNSPSNPTGMTISKNDWEKIIELARKNDAWILCDEVFWPLSSEDLPSVSDLYEKGIATCSFSKAFSLSGLRFGWVKADEKLIHMLNERRDYTIISLGALKESLAYGALKNKDEILKKNMNHVNQNKAFLKNWLYQNPHYWCVIPENGTVGFLGYDFDIGSENLMKKLLEEAGVFMVPGKAFDKEGYMRIGFASNLDTFSKGLYTLSQWTESYIKQVSKNQK